MIGHAQPAAPVGCDSIGRPLQAMLRAVAFQGCKPALVDELIESGRAAGSRLRMGWQPAFDPGLLVEIADIHAGAAARLRDCRTDSVHPRRDLTKQRRIHDGFDSFSGEEAKTVPG